MPPIVKAENIWDKQARLEQEHHSSLLSQGVDFLMSGRKPQTGIEREAFNFAAIQFGSGKPSSLDVKISPTIPIFPAPVKDTSINLGVPIGLAGISRDTIDLQARYLGPKVDHQRDILKSLGGPDFTTPSTNIPSLTGFKRDTLGMEDAWKPKPTTFREYAFVRDALDARAISLASRASNLKLGFALSQPLNDPLKLGLSSTPNSFGLEDPFKKVRPVSLIGYDKVDPLGVGVFKPFMKSSVQTPILGLDYSFKNKGIYPPVSKPNDSFKQGYFGLDDLFGRNSLTEKPKQTDFGLSKSLFPEISSIVPSTLDVKFYPDASKLLVSTLKNRCPLCGK